MQEGDLLGEVLVLQVAVDSGQVVEAEDVELQVLVDVLAVGRLEVGGEQALGEHWGTRGGHTGQGVFRGAVESVRRAGVVAVGDG